MVRQIAPLCFTKDIPATVTYYKDKLGFECLGTWQDPPVYAMVARDGQQIHFRCAEPPTANPNKYRDELLDAYLFVEDVDALYAEYAGQGVEFTRGLANMPWRSREFVVKDCDGRLLAFGANLYLRVYSANCVSEYGARLRSFDAFHPRRPSLF